MDKHVPTEGFPLDEPKLVLRGVHEASFPSYRDHASLWVCRCERVARTPLVLRSPTATKKSCLQTTSSSVVSNISQSNLRTTVAVARYNSAYARLRALSVETPAKMFVMEGFGLLYAKTLSTAFSE